ncbi:DNA/RNA non-specific endonuclease [Acetobacteraceae bacterium]|nr:DNA/RNA non-specific endonuclease [Acetobacteraceae bacterium]
MLKKKSHFDILKCFSFFLPAFFYLTLSPQKAFAQCPRFAAAGEFPTAGEILCNDNYAVGYSNSRRSPLWAAEKLTADQTIVSQKTANPIGNINTDPRIDQGISLADYQKGAWKPLSLAAIGDMASAKAKQQTMLQSNIIPVTTSLKQKVWRKLEENTRKLLAEYGTINVLTGVIFGDSSQSFGKNNARLPDKVWKVIYVPRQGTAAVLCNNNEPLHCTTTTVQEIENLCYIGLFPGLSESESNRQLHPDHWPGI